MGAIIWLSLFARIERRLLSLENQKFITKLSTFSCTLYHTGLHANCVRHIHGHAFLTHYIYCAWNFHKQTKNLDIKKNSRSHNIWPPYLLLLLLSLLFCWFWPDNMKNVDLIQFNVMTNRHVHMFTGSYPYSYILNCVWLLFLVSLYLAFCGRFEKMIFLFALCVCVPNTRTNKHTEREREKNKTENSVCCPFMLFKWISVRFCHIFEAEFFFLVCVLCMVKNGINLNQVKSNQIKSKVGRSWSHKHMPQRMGKSHRQNDQR